MTDEVESTKSAEKDESCTGASADEQNIEKDPATEEQKDCSRFSEDGMDTEIEVSSEELEQPDRKKKKLKKHRSQDKDCDSTQECIANNDKQHNEDKKEKPPVSDSEDVESMPTDRSEKIVKGNWKSKIRNIKLTPVLALLALKVCVILPIAIYACDVIISMNVLDDQTVMMKDHIQNNWNIPYESFLRLKYKHNYTGTILRYSQKAAEEEYYLTSDKAASKTSKKRNKHVIDVTTSVTALSQENATNESITTTPNNSTLEPTQFYTSSNGTVMTTNQMTTMSSLTTKRNETETATSAQVNSTLASTTMPASTSPQSHTPGISSTMSLTEFPTSQSNSTTDDGRFTLESEEITTQPIDIYETSQYCYHEIYFIKQHMNYDELYNLDWHSSIISTLQKYQQALFFMYTVFGVLFLISSIIMRCDIFLNQKWSSYLVLTFLLYAISTSLTAHVFHLQTSKGGLRCFLCRFHGWCDDINPWNLEMAGYFPTKVNWTLVAFLSMLFKAYDCLVIGCVTLWFVVDFKADPIWFTFIKVFGWLIIFPVMMFTPLFGVLAFEVLPGTGLINTAECLAMIVMFGIGCAFWGVSLILLPIFCKLRMCGENSDEEDSEEDMY